MFKQGDIAYIIENNRKVEQVKILQHAYGLYTVQLIKRGGTFRVKEHRLFSSEQKAELELAKIKLKRDYGELLR